VGKTFSGPNGGIYQFPSVTGGDAYTASAWFVNSSTDALTPGETDDVRMIFFDGPNGTGNYLGTVVSTATVSNANPFDAWTQLTVQAAAPATAQSVQWMAFFNDPAYTSGALFVDDASLLDTSWNGGGADNNWSTNNNWGGVAPGQYAPLVFAGTQRLNNNNDFPAATPFYGIAFTATAGSFTLNGNQVNLASDVVNNSTNTQTIALDLGLQQDTNFNTAAGNVTVTGAIGGAFAVTKLGGKTLTLSGANTYTGATTVQAGTLQLAQEVSLYDDNYTGWRSSDSITVASGATLALNVGGPGEFTSYDIQLLGSVGSPGSYLGLDTTNAAGGNFTCFTIGIGIGNNPIGLVKLGTNTLTVEGVTTYTGGTTVQAGTLLISTPGALPANGPVTIAGGLLQLAPGVSGGSGPAATSGMNISSLSIAGSGQMDVNNNHVIITYGSSDPIGAITGYIKSGYNGGGWNGPGIISTAALTKTNGLSYGVGYADGADGRVSGLVSGQIEVAYTLLGDANLDGLVNAADFTILAANFNQPVTGWDQGDFNYDGLVNAADFTDLAANFNQSVSGAASAGDVAALDAFAAANGISLAAVPEPATMGLLALGAVGVLGRRRRQ
jgi:autotransporter-associated beta strand protein